MWKERKNGKQNATIRQKMQIIIVRDLFFFFRICYEKEKKKKKESFLFQDIEKNESI